jgi:hypothetical protein
MENVKQMETKEEQKPSKKESVEIIDKTVKEFINAYNYAITISNGSAKKLSDDKKTLIDIIAKDSILMLAVNKFIKLNVELGEDINFNNSVINNKYYVVDEEGCPIYDVVGKNKEGVDIRVNKIKLAEIDDQQKELLEYGRSNVKVKIYKCPTNKLPENIPIELEPLNGFILDYDFYPKTY